MNVAMPWAMESTRKRPGFYAQFVVFHLGVAAAIAATFIIPYAPGVVRDQVDRSPLPGDDRGGLHRRAHPARPAADDPVLRLVSTPDDYFSLILMILFFAAGVLAVPNRPEKGEWPLILFFGLTAFFLVYVPFSKICHYLYYPFTRYFLGRSLGHRGAFPPSPGKRAAAPAGKERAVKRRKRGPSGVVDAPLDPRTQTRAKQEGLPSVKDGRLKTYEPGDNVSRFLDLLGRRDHPIRWRSR